MIGISKVTLNRYFLLYCLSIILLNLMITLRTIVKKELVIPGAIVSQWFAFIYFDKYFFLSEKRFKIISEPMANFLCQNQFFKIKNSTLWKLNSWVKSPLHGSDRKSLLDVLWYWWFFQIKASYIWLRFYFFASEEGYPKTNRWVTVRHYLHETMKSQICFQFIWVDAK